MKQSVVLATALSILIILGPAFAADVPAPGTGDTDNLYLFTLGYGFDTTRKR